MTDPASHGPNEVVFDRAAHATRMVGHHFRLDDYYEVGREKIREYALAVHNHHPVFHEQRAAEGLGHPALPVPPTFTSMIANIAHHRLFTTIVKGYNLSEIVQTDQVFEFHRPVRAGSRLVCDAYLDSFRQMAGSDILVTTVVFSDQTGEPVQTVHSTFMARTGSGRVDENIARIAMEVIKNGVIASV